MSAMRTFIHKYAFTQFLVYLATILSSADGTGNELLSRCCQYTRSDLT
jgi:hypothetical protein